MTNENEEKKVRVKLERHQWPDEIEEQKQVKKRKLNDVFIAILAILTMLSLFFVGYIAGRGTRNSSGTTGTTTGGQSSKIEEALDIMENDWYFSDSLENGRDQLIDQALYGMTTNEADLHTEYFSAEELETFTQSINSNFVGIGVQYLDLEEGYIVERVFRNSPAEQAGVQAGDIFYSVDGDLVENMDTDTIRDRVRGEKGTVVVIEFMRQGELVELSITRDEVSGTAYGEMIDSSIGYLEISSFGDTTAQEVQDNLDSLTEQGMTKLIIDLRDNGGGYLDTYLHLAGYFIGKGEVAIQQKYSDGSLSPATALGDLYTNINGIVVLINENTASASEVLAIALREQREDVTIVGTTSYGKGTVQITIPFRDGSALKYTTSEWLSPSGESIHGVGIAPDVEVKDHEVFYEWFSGEEDFSYHYDSVSDEVKSMQLALDFLGFNVARVDGYFDQSTQSALIQFKTEHQLDTTDELNPEVMSVLKSAVISEWRLNDEKDTQLQKAIELLK
ncbi:MAG: S41 family peptidase [Anaerorhabdus sp.]